MKLWWTNLGPKFGVITERESSGLNCPALRHGLGARAFPNQFFDSCTADRIDWIIRVVL